MLRGKYRLFAALLLLIFITACAKSPRWTEDASFSIEPAVSEEEGGYRLFITAGFFNETDSTAFLNIEGFIDIYKNNSILISLPFKADMLLPFERIIVDAEADVDSDKAVRIMDLLDVDKEIFFEEGRISDQFISTESVEVRLEKYEREDIIKLLRKISDEKY